MLETVRIARARNGEQTSIQDFSFYLYIAAIRNGTGIFNYKIDEDPDIVDIYYRSKTNDIYIDRILFSPKDKELRGKLIAKLSSLFPKEPLLPTKEEIIAFRNIKQRKV